MKRGFTLIELLAVVLIMGILIAIALPRWRRSVERTRVAEALQMLPAIYDARERLVTERGWTWASTTTPPVTFGKIDLEMKGTPDGDTSMETENFIYNLVQSCEGRRCVIMAEPWVSARFQKGIYNGATIFYKGGNFSCCPGSAPSDTCERLNLTEGSCTIRLPIGGRL